MDMMDKVRQAVLRLSPPKNYPVRPGDTVRVHIKVKEGDKERVQIFEGAVLKIQGRDISRSFTVRKISQGVGVEKTFPFAAPNIVKTEITGRAKVRRARLFYLRNRKGRAARLMSVRFSAQKETAQKESDKPKEETAEAKASPAPVAPAVKTAAAGAAAPAADATASADPSASAATGKAPAAESDG